MSVEGWQRNFVHYHLRMRIQQESIILKYPYELKIRSLETRDRLLQIVRSTKTKLLEQRALQLLVEAEEKAPSKIFVSVINLVLRNLIRLDWDY